MKNVYKHFKWFGAALLLMVVILVYNGCDDFLAEPPRGTLDELTLANEQGVEGNLISAYRVLGGWTTGIGGNWGGAGSNWVLGSVPSDDAGKGSENLDQPDINPIELYNWGSSGAEATLNDKWRTVYEGVVRSNATLRLLNRLQAENPDAIPEATANSIRGEALFLRAHFHFEAWKTWENIPYFFEDDAENAKTNVGVDAIGNIINDLEQAANLLPETPRNGEVGRVTSWTARAYLGRVQVYSGDYVGALSTLTEVRESGPYELEENYHHVWTGFTDLANGPETILAYQASSNDGQPDGANANYGDRLNFPHSGSPFGCCGFHQPSQNLVNFFQVDDDGLPLALTDPSWNDRDENFTSEFNDVPVDPRLDWTVGRDGVPYKDWGPHASGWIRDASFGGPYSPKKNVHEDASGAESSVGWNAQHLNSVNIHLYRYADLLLLLAEAEVEAGSLDRARDIVNKIRERAGVAAQGEGNSREDIAVPIDDPSITWANYQIGTYDSFPDQEFARTAVRYERRVELAMEGHRFFDLRRWQIAEEVLNNFTSVEQNRRGFIGGAAPYTDRHQLYPIPEIQIELSEVEGESVLEQNPGW